MKVKLVREPKNEAIQMQLRSTRMTMETWAGMKLGYIGRETAAELAPRLDKKQIQIKALCWKS
jgi:hypothetical protein